MSIYARSGRSAQIGHGSRFRGPARKCRPPSSRAQRSGRAHRGGSFRAPWIESFMVRLAPAPRRNVLARVHPGSRRPGLTPPRGRTAASTADSPARDRAERAREVGETAPERGRGGAQGEKLLKGFSGRAGQSMMSRSSEFRLQPLHTPLPHPGARLADTVTAHILVRRRTPTPSR